MSNRLNAAGVELDFSRLELPSDLGEQYRQAIDRAVAEMTAVEAGENVNTDEGRMVGHYWLRNPELAPGELGSTITQTQESIDEFARDVFTDGSLIFCGLALADRAWSTAALRFTPSPRRHSQSVLL